MIGSMLHSGSTTPFMILRTNENVISKRKGREEKNGLWDLIVQIAPQDSNQ